MSLCLLNFKNVDQSNFFDRSKQVLESLINKSLHVKQTVVKRFVSYASFTHRRELNLFDK